MTIIRKICFVAAGTACTSSVAALIAFSTSVPESKKEEIKDPANLTWGKDIGTYKITYESKEAKTAFESWF